MLIAAVKLVADDRVAEVLKVDADLMLPPGVRIHPQQAEIALHPRKTPLHSEVRPRRRAIGAHAVLDGNDRALVFPQRCLAGAGVGLHVAVDDSLVFFFDRTLGEELLQL